MTAKGIIIVLAKMADKGKYGLSRAELIVFDDGSGHLKLDGERVEGGDFKNADDLCNILEQIDKE